MSSRTVSRKQCAAAPGGGQGRPRRARALGVRAVADRAAVMEPGPALPVSRRLGRGIGAEGHQLGHLVVREPELDVLGIRGETGEPDGADCTGV